ncbi:uncharacterized protein ACLA_002620 [Aspergillus clavatus NRRL 1]|uniref:Uncharacterized protein n=1 Tax=Aspergillus clavatus (strain ATCC 1007 / CBS 513.65 / DSM 816 / NCTC 3887 / NRRL 1 / QM 1276 / 107) TaxID=344612 RepID=A1C583_ASPCL|nr:uncharacterized protein ACLA_002620 [Aspergillus clavatus NRRL 1]EAW14851.1 conserved hypothetical protein [Aspergillus clavatus NRRL 1]
MAALTITPSNMIRQPFASLDTPRLRSLLKSKMNKKNQQHGASMAAKRTPLSEVDTENINPATLNMSTKRKRGSDEEDHQTVKSTFKSPKSSRVALVTIESKSAPLMPSTIFKAPLPKPKSSSAPKPIGRSPPPKTSKPFARRSTITKSRPHSTGKKSVARPFSIAAALGTLKPKSQPTPKAPASWAFDIYVDSEQEEMTNLMQHSTCVLDISDDECKVETSSRGKENIPPSELGLGLPHFRQSETTRPTRKTEMTDEPRSPLGELNAADYYGADCHAFSYAVIYEDAENTPEKKTSLPPLPRTAAHPSRSKLSSVSSISSLIEATQPSKSAESARPESSEAEIQIWESSSVDGEESTSTHPESTS